MSNPTKKAPRRLIVAIDGPAGAGKSTLAKGLAGELGYMYLDTGAMYRALAWRVVKEGIKPEDEKALEVILKNMDLKLLNKNGSTVVRVDGVDVSNQIRTPEISQMASKVSTIAAVRERMVELQRAMGADGGIVAEGRDMTTVVFPDAEVKVYLDASLEERARRRFQELKAQGKKTSMDKTLKEMDERDRRDREREVSPLTQAGDAIVIDSTTLGAAKVLDRIKREIAKKC